MIKRLFLVRHGQTPWNAEKRYQGITDIPLSEEGRNQARLLADEFEKTHIDVIYSSPLQRAYDTAKEIASRKGIDIIVEDSFIEIDYGEWEGKTIPELTALYGDYHIETLKHPGDDRYKFPGEGSFRNVLKRITPALDRIMNEPENEGKSVMIVAHGGILKLMTLYLLGLDVDFYPKFWMDNTGVNIFDERFGDLTLIRLNDKTHLRKVRYKDKG
ncbi:MAG: histidine phosphatase family protein [Firmicutes bacterium]|nr:histidine phosphatase family protein [Bacillota bacterium]MBQ7241561.1 histidine phosphatase family protein [Bacillota bacterium]MBR0105499.1 histidine phosphatase family protein [Bacillota bacterium]MBR2593900.1 histidine phosphatase family protein [Bacillota bacterium]